jgi:hypothetical protein
LSIFAPRFSSQAIAVQDNKQLKSSKEMQNESSRLQRLLHTQIAKMDGEELVYLLQSFSKGEPEQHEPVIVQAERKYVYGIAGIAQIFGCSIPTASRIKRSGIINAAISQVGRKITVDVDKALELAKNGEHLA